MYVSNIKVNWQLSKWAFFDLYHIIVSWALVYFQSKSHIFWSYQLASLLIVCLISFASNLYGLYSGLSLAYYCNHYRSPAHINYLLTWWKYSWDKFFEAFHNFVYFVFPGTLSTNATLTNLEMESPWLHQCHKLLHLILPSCTLYSHKERLQGNKGRTS